MDWEIEIQITTLKSIRIHKPQHTINTRVSISLGGQEGYPLRRELFNDYLSPDDW